MTYESTRLETDEEVQQALRRYRPAPRVAAVAPAPLPASAPAPADDSPPPFRPTQCPPLAVLTVFDDGADGGETIRIRQDQFVIGRTEGDLLIAHDAQMSGRHAELRRKLHKDRHRWVLSDLGSTNGTFVRVGHACCSMARNSFSAERGIALKTMAPRRRPTLNRRQLTRIPRVPGRQVPRENWSPSLSSCWDRHAAHASASRDANCGWVRTQAIARWCCATTPSPAPGMRAFGWMTKGAG